MLNILWVHRIMLKLTRREKCFIYSFSLLNVVNTPHSTNPTICTIIMYVYVTISHGSLVLYLFTFLSQGEPLYAYAASINFYPIPSTQESTKAFKGIRWFRSLTFLLSSLLNISVTVIHLKTFHIDLWRVWSHLLYDTSVWSY